MRQFFVLIFVWLWSVTAVAAHEPLKTFVAVPPGFESYVIQPGDTWESITASDTAERLAMRINRMNVEPRAGSTVLLPVSQTAWDYVPVPYSVPSTGRHLVVYVDRQFFGAYENGQLIHWGPVSTGRPSKSTPLGHFTAKWKSRWHRSSIYNNARMYFAIQFKGDYFTHEYTELPGYPASSGCVRMFWDDAEWKFAWLQSGDRVSVLPDTNLSQW